MATVSGGTLTVSLVDARINADGSAWFTLKYTNPSGQIVMMRTVYMDAAGSQLVDDKGNVVATPAPAALVTDTATYVSELNTIIANGASSGKLNP